MQQMVDLGVLIFPGHKPQHNQSNDDGRQRKDCYRDIKAPWGLQSSSPLKPTQREQNHSQDNAHPFDND